jgi:OOP family OmpA-OmpF porin
MVAVALQAVAETVPEAVAAADAQRAVVVDKSAPAAMAAVPMAEAAPAAAVAPAPAAEIVSAAAVAPAPAAEIVSAAAVAPAPAAEIAPAAAAAALATPAPAAVPAKMSFATDTFFDFDKSVLKAEGKAKLKELGEKIKNISLEVVIVVGHTDSVGTDAYNQKLSQRRAEAVKAYMVSLGVAKNRIYTEGKGESEPAADNKTSAGRAKNRRVEVEVIGSK